MKVFISRSLSSDSVFRRLLESRGVQVIGSPLVVLSPIAFLNIPACDWIFFSSKNAVTFFFRQLPDPDVFQPVKWAAIGPSTAKAMAEYRLKMDFTGTGDPEATALLFAPLAVGQTVLFPGARHSREGVQRLLPPEIRCLPLAIYNNTPLPHPTLQTEDILVFTSPMNAVAYFSTQVLQEKQQVVAIGKSTFTALQELGIEPLSMAPETSEAGLAEAVMAQLPAGE